MRPRSFARRLALQYLFMADLAGAEDCQPLGEFLAEHAEREDAREYASRLVRGILGDLDGVDEIISGAADNWKIDRIASVERNILRVACFEMRGGEVPANVVIDEAVELAKKFGSKVSGGFVNGVLDRVRKNISAA